MAVASGSVSSTSVSVGRRTALSKRPLSRETAAQPSRHPSTPTTRTNSSLPTAPGRPYSRCVVRLLAPISIFAGGTNHPEKIRGWYNLAGGGSGFMPIEADDPRELTEILEPYMDLVSWDVHGVYELPYEATVESFRSMLASV